MNPYNDRVKPSADDLGIKTLLPHVLLTKLKGDIVKASKRCLSKTESDPDFPGIEEVNLENSLFALGYYFGEEQPTERKKLEIDCEDGQKFTILAHSYPTRAKGGDHHQAVEVYHGSSMVLRAPYDSFIKEPQAAWREALAKNLHKVLPSE